MKWHCFLWKKGKVFGNESFRCWLSWYHCDMCMYVCACVCTSHVQPFMTLWTVACKAPLSMEFSRQEYWSGLPFPSPGGSSWPRDRTCISCVSCIGRQALYQLSHHPCDNYVLSVTYHPWPLPSEIQGLENGEASSNQSSSLREDTMWIQVRTLEWNKLYNFKQTI